MLEVRGISCHYGRLMALDQVSLTVAPGELVALLGMNGAGKTTLLSVLSGLLKPSAGQVLWRGQDVTGWPPARLVAAGVVQAPEGRQVFAPLSVRENLMLGAYLRLKAGQKAEAAADLERALEMFPALRPRLEQAAGTLSGGEQQMLAVGRALMARPALLLLDEPSLGLAPRVAAEIMHTARQLTDAGTGVLLVEQNALGALGVARRGYIITGGRIRFAGRPEEILADRQLREAFLGPERARRSDKQPNPEGGGR